MKGFSLALLFCLSLATAACGKITHLPRPDSDKDKQITQEKELSKKKNRYLSKITSLENESDRLAKNLIGKRSRGYNTTEAETVLELIQKAVKEAKDMLYWDKFEELDLKLDEIKVLENKSDNLIKKAPEFGSGQPVKKEKKVQRKYMDPRDWIKELRGEPDPKNKHFRAPSRVELRVTDASPIITSSNCWSSPMQAFMIGNPPSIESWYYPEDQTIYVFMETNSIIDQFMLRNELSSLERDRLLSQLCPAQTYSGYKLIYAGPPITDANQIIEQVFMGTFRSADMFGVGALDRLAKAEAALPDLTIAGIAFSTELEPLNKQQKEYLLNFVEIIKKINPEVVAVLINIDENEEFHKTFEETKSAEPPFGPETLSIMEELNKIRLSNQTPDLKKKKNKDLVDRQDKLFKSRLEALDKILLWQRTLKSNQKDVSGLVKIFPQKSKQIKESLDKFGKSLDDLADEFDKVRKQLLKFKNKLSLELAFKEGKPPACFFLLEGVRFEEKTLPNGEKVELPDLSVKIQIQLNLSKKEEPVLVEELEEIKITAANNVIYEVRDMRRLTSFGIKFPTTLVPGNYAITFLVTDNLRAKTVKQVITWLVVPSVE